MAGHRLARRSGHGRMRITRFRHVGLSGGMLPNVPPHIPLLGLLGMATAGYEPAQRERIEHLSTQILEAIKPVVDGTPGDVIASALTIVSAHIHDLIARQLPPPARAEAYRTGLYFLSDEAEDIHLRRIRLGFRDALDDIALILGALCEALSAAKRGRGSLASALTDASLADSILQTARRENTPVATLISTILIVARHISSRAWSEDRRMARDMYGTGLRVLTRYLGCLPAESVVVVDTISGVVDEGNWEKRRKRGESR